MLGVSERSAPSNSKVQVEGGTEGWRQHGFGLFALHVDGHEVVAI